jgi:hypothetical protein
LLARDERQTLARFLETWQDKMRHTVKQSTWLRYQQHLAHLPPEMKRTPIARLTPQQVQGWYSQLLSEGLSTTTVHHMHTVLHHALRDALRLGVVPRNVTEDQDIAAKAMEHAFLDALSSELSSSKDEQEDES